MNRPPPSRYAPPRRTWSAGGRSPQPGVPSPWCPWPMFSLGQAVLTNGFHHGQELDTARLRLRPGDLVAPDDEGSSGGVEQRPVHVEDGHTEQWTVRPEAFSASRATSCCVFPYRGETQQRL